MARISIEVCDICRDPERPVVRFTVRRAGEPGRPMSLALCQEDRAPLEDLLLRAKQDRLVSGRHNGAPVTTVEEIEAVKATRKKTAAKKAPAARRR